MKLVHQVTRKSVYTTNRMYTLGIRVKHEILPGCSLFDV